MTRGQQQLGVLMAFFLGIVVADQFVVVERFYIILLCFILGSGLWWRMGWLRTVFVSVALLALLGGVARMEWAQLQFVNSPLSGQIDQSITVTGDVVREVDVRESFAQLYVRVEGELLLVRTDRFTAAQYGDTISVTGQLEKPSAFATDLGRVFDYQNYLKARGVQYVVSFARVSVVESGSGSNPIRWLLATKDKFAAAVTASLPPPQSDLGLGLLLGIKQALGEDLENAFRRTGLIHIVVLSGYNVMLVIAFFWWVTSWFLPLRGRVGLSLLGIVLFAIMVGLSATVVRASIMASILLLAKFIGTRYDVLRALLFAGLVMVVLNPYVLLYDLGFQLSFMATLGLVLFLPQFESTVVTDTKKIGLRDIFLATVVTQIAVLPLLIFHIGEVSIVSVVVNVLALPVVAVAMALTFATGLVALVSPILVLPIAFVTNLVLLYIITIVTWFDRLPFAAVVVPPISVWQLVGMYVLLGVVLWLWYTVKHAKGDTAVSPTDPPVFFR